MSDTIVDLTESNEVRATKSSVEKESLLRLSAGELQLELAPEVGGSIARFFSLRGSEAHHWLRPATDEMLKIKQPLGMASFPLVPWCNRIRNGRSKVGARPFRLPPNYGSAPHTIHGIGWQRPWDVGTVSKRKASLNLTHPASDWPYSFSAEQVFDLNESGLHVSMTVVNQDTVPMPLGLGHHPYVPHRPGTKLTVDVEKMWRGDSELLPTQLEKPDFLDELRRGRVLEGLHLDNNFTGWSRSATVDWPNEGMRLTLQAEAPLNYFVLYSPKEYDFFCIEPVSNCTDWINLQHHPQSEVGGTLLMPGQTLQAEFELRIEWL